MCLLEHSSLLIIFHGNLRGALEPTLLMGDANSGVALYVDQTQTFFMLYVVSLAMHKILVGLLSMGCNLSS